MTEPHPLPYHRSDSVLVRRMIELAVDETHVADRHERGTCWCLVQGGGGMKSARHTRQYPVPRFGATP
jgi:hypothetical protein